MTVTVLDLLFFSFFVFEVRHLGVDYIMFTGGGTVGPKAEVVDREGFSEAYNVNRSEGKETTGANSVLMGKQMHDSRSAAFSRADIFQADDIEKIDLILLKIRLGRFIMGFVAVDTSEDSEVKGSDEEDLAWTTWFCKLPGNEFLCEVDDYFILDNFNLCGLRHQVPYYDHALDLILDDDSSSHGGKMITDEQNELIESSAEMLYGLIHARYILTDQGFLCMLNKYNKSEFGRCPRDAKKGVVAKLCSKSVWVQVTQAVKGKAKGRRLLPRNLFP
ncbi:hypothetical protein Bca4012_083195 [Brassica carinata]